MHCLSDIDGRNVGSVHLGWDQLGADHEIAIVIGTLGFDQRRLGWRWPTCLLSVDRTPARTLGQGQPTLAL
jgi:hypothetical protein